MIHTILTELNEVWGWITGLVAGLGLTVSLLIIAIILLSLKVTKISSRIQNLENRLISTERDFNFEIKKFKDKQ
jgi:hypothetical protein